MNELTPGGDDGQCRARYGHVMRRLQTRPPTVDVALACALGVAAQVMVWSGHVPGNRAAMSVLFLLVGWPLVVRRSHPLVPVVALTAAISIQSVVTGDAAEGAALLLTGLVGIYSVAAWGSRRVAWVGLAITAVGGAISSVEDRHMRTTAQLWAGSFFLLLLLVAWVGGLAVRAHRSARVVEQEAADAERRHAETVTAERSRIARELHDVIAHNVSVIVLQAVAAQGVLGVEPERARDPLSRIEESGREALDELRRLVGVMRDIDGVRDLEPQPGLADLVALTDTVRAAGLQVELKTEGLAAPLPRAIDLSAYRIVQEALTNTLKHAGPASAKVSVRRSADAVEIEVLDDGAGRVAPTNGGGHGLVGMRERAALYNGSVEAGARAGGGFRIHALLPLEPAG
jgi:signal transduction histidine kinase